MAGSRAQLWQQVQHILASFPSNSPKMLPLSDLIFTSRFTSNSLHNGRAKGLEMKSSSRTWEAQIECLEKLRRLGLLINHFGGLFETDQYDVHDHRISFVF